MMLLMESEQPLYAIAFTMTGEKSDGHRYYLALVMNATVKTPQDLTQEERDYCLVVLVLA